MTNPAKMPRPTIISSSAKYTPNPSDSSTSPPSPTPSTPLSTAPSSPLSSAPSSPQRPPTRIKSQRCRENDCPITHFHYEGVYFHHGRHAQDTGTPFGDSNPPPHVWDAAKKIRDRKGDTEDDLSFFAFMRYHGPREWGSGWVGEWRMK